MAAADDLEILEDTIDGVRTITIRNNSKDKTIEAQVLVSAIDQKAVYKVTLKPLGVDQVAHERPDATRCLYEIDTAVYLP